MPYQDWTLKTDRICPNQITLHCRPHRLFYWWSQRLQFCNCPRHLMFLELRPFLFMQYFTQPKIQNFASWCLLTLIFIFSSNYQWMKLYGKFICSVLYTYSAYSMCINLTVASKFRWRSNNKQSRPINVCFISVG